MTGKPLAAGTEIESTCTKCKAVFNHTIIAMVGGRVARVKCNTCGSEHNHRPEKTPGETAGRKSPAKTAPVSRSRSKKDPEELEREEYEKLFHARDTGKAIPYNMGGAFRIDDLIDHPAFGFGIVRSRHDSKMEVLFSMGKKLLRCK